MSRFTLLFVLLAGTVSAQTLPSSASLPELVPATANTEAAAVAPTQAPPVALSAAADTVQALHRLYAQRRTGGLLLTILGGGYLLYVGAIAPFAIGFGGAGLIPVVATAALVGGTTTGLSIRKLVRFSESKEAEMVADYEQNHKLPYSIRRKLKPNHFRD